MKKPDLRGNKGLSPDEALLLISRFAEQNPVEFERWKAVEVQGSSLNDIFDSLKKFLQENCEYNSLTDLTLGVVELRRAMHAAVNRQ